MLDLVLGWAAKVEKKSGLCERERSARYGKTKEIIVYWSDGDVTYVKASDDYLYEWEQEALYNCNLWLEGCQWGYEAAVAKIQWGAECTINEIEIRI